MSEQTDLSKEPGSPGSWQKQKIALAGGALLLIIAAAFGGWKLLGSDKEKIDAATQSLEIASRGLALNNEVAGFARQIAANPGGDYAARLDQAQQNLASLQEDVLENSALAPQLQKATAQSLRAANEMRRVTQELRAARQALRESSKKKATKLDQQAQRLQALVRQLELSRLLRQALQAYRLAIISAAEDLQEEGGLDQESQSSIEASKTAIEEEISSVDAVDGLVEEGLSQTSADLVSGSYLLRSVLGPARCGKSTKGNLVVLSSGRMPCAEAITIANDYESDNLVQGWNCSGQAITLSGVALDLASGRSCSSRGRLISMYNEDVVAQIENSRGPAGCGIKQLYSSRGTPSDFPLFVLNLDCQYASEIAQKFWGAGEQKRATIDGFLCQRTSNTWESGDLAFQCLRGDRGVYVNWLGYEPEG